MKLGIYGGTFSPVHVGHIKSAEAFTKSVGLDKLLIIPANIPPHKSADGIVEAETRLEMCRLAFDGVKNAEVCDIELRRKGKSYTFDTLTEMRKSVDGEIFLLCGTDMIATFDEWYRFEDIFGMATVVLSHRFGETKKERLAAEKKIKEYREKYGAKIITLDAPPVEISSTEIRRMIACGEDASEYIPENEYAFIKEKELYVDRRSTS